MIILYIILGLLAALIMALLVAVIRTLRMPRTVEQLRRRGLDGPQGLALLLSL